MKKLIFTVLLISFQVIAVFGQSIFNSIQPNINTSNKDIKPKAERWKNSIEDDNRNNEIKFGFGINHLPNFSNAINNFNSSLGFNFQSSIGRTYKIEYSTWKSSKFQVFVNYTLLNISFENNNNKVQKEVVGNITRPLFQIHNIQLGGKYSIYKRRNNNLNVQGAIGVQSLFVEKFTASSLRDNLISKNNDWGFNILSFRAPVLHNYTFHSSGSRVTYTLGLEYTHKISEKIGLFIEQNIQAAPFEVFTMREEREQQGTQPAISQTLRLNLNNYQLNTGLKYLF